MNPTSQRQYIMEIESLRARVAELESERDQWRHEFKAAYKRETELEAQLAAIHKKIAEAQVVGYLDGRGRFFYAEDPWMKEDHLGMPTLIRREDLK